MLRRNLVCLVMAGLLLAAGAVQAAQSPTDLAVQTAMQKELAKKDKLSNIQVFVDDRVATLTGNVAEYRDLLSAEKLARGYKALTAVHNNIVVNGPAVSDEELQTRLSRKLANDRTFQGNVFDAFFIGVKDGVVTINGFAHTYPARDSAIAIVQNQKGVRNVIANIEVLPLSNHDDRIRILAARHIYGSYGLGRYATDPAHPIRIIVENGNLRLEGAVAREMDRTLAGVAANQVPGVFSVTNNLKIDSEAGD